MSPRTFSEASGIASCAQRREGKDLTGDAGVFALMAHHSWIEDHFGLHMETYFSGSDSVAYPMPPFS